jgi:hypothetical protein
MKQQLSTANDYKEACDLLRSGYVKHVRLGWNVGSDEFFRIASDWCDTGAKIKKEGENFVISLKGFLFLLSTKYHSVKTADCIHFSQQFLFLMSL